ncbi:hypothetical protein FA13DRAFT_1716780 [Coprinellus micaceus]|uniref:Uncharacterized protein n=1 Tax=Coprinellus micaceus TaxID=71717 RepID=A0A4Y7SI68_COPMI|nr:hypothetical protein FA13DRAFT_1716780 [Coprinellus micaceus]
MSKALNHRSVEHSLLDLLIVPNLPPAGCHNHGPLSNTVYMGIKSSNLYAVRRVSCRKGCMHTTRMLTHDEKIEVSTKLAIAAGLIRDLQKLMWLGKWLTCVYDPVGHSDPEPVPQNQRGVLPAGPRARHDSDTDMDTDTDTDTDDTSTIVVPSKRKATGPPERIFERRPLPLLPDARGSEINLFLASGEKVRGFDKTDL